MAKSFRDLKVWSLSMDLAMLIYELTSDFPKHEIYGLTSQMRRASVSIASNFAEGSARKSKKDFGQFVTMARGSNCELQTQLMIAARLHYSTPERLAHAESLSNEVGRMLNGLSDYLKLPLTTKN
jgi:four helix bundle protein